MRSAFGLRRRSIARAGATALIIATAAAADAFAYECVLLRDQPTEAIDRVKRDAVANGGYVFAFRHSNRAKSGGGLSDDGLTEARKAADAFAALLKTPDGRMRTERVKAFELAPYGSRVAETRAAVLPGFAAAGTKSQDIPQWLAGEWTRLSPAGGFNTFLFGNQKMLESLTCAKEPCNFGCLEGVVLKPAPDGEIGLCYRLYPAEWAEPRTDAVPPWYKDRTADFSGICAGAR